jgi:hypothetical protein
MLKKIIVTGGNGRFAQELKKQKADINLFLEVKNNSISCQLNQLKKI